MVLMRFSILLISPPDDIRLVKSEISSPERPNALATSRIAPRTANVFIVERGSVLTPPLAGVLPGVTRAKVLVACELFRIPTQEVSVALERLRLADEIFVTSAVRGVVPVTKLDGAERPAGPITARIAGYINARPAI